MKLALLVGASAALLMAEGLRSPGGLEVHEWGTFTSVAGEYGLPASWDTLGCTSDLPSFVKDSGFRNLKGSIPSTIRMETPVIYFYSPVPVTANVSVRFPQGRVTEWYPQASVRDYSAGSMSSNIEWTDVKVQPNMNPALPTEAGASPYYAARGTESAPLEVGGQHEKFLFYRGVGEFRIPLSARAGAGGRVSVTNVGSSPVPGVLLFDNHGGRMRYRKVGQILESAELPNAGQETTTAELRGILEAELTFQGLFPMEAKAMLDTWHDSWFEEGTRLIYIMPKNTVEEILRLKVEPAPARVRRVFVGRVELVSEATMQTVATAMEKDDLATIQRYRRFLEPVLERVTPGMARRKSADLLPRVRCR